MSCPLVTVLVDLTGNIDLPIPRAARLLAVDCRIPACRQVQ